MLFRPISRVILDRKHWESECYLYVTVEFSGSWVNCMLMIFKYAAEVSLHFILSGCPQLRQPQFGLPLIPGVSQGDSTRPFKHSQPVHRTAAACTSNISLKNKNKNAFKYPTLWTSAYSQQLMQCNWRIKKGAKSELKIINIYIQMIYN